MLRDVNIVYYQGDGAHIFTRQKRNSLTPITMDRI